jgi:DNA repair exonuclease SbcCD ATPase subunit
VAIEQDVKLTIDKAAAARVEAALDSINAQSRELKAEFSRGNITLDKFTGELGRADAEARRLQQTLASLESPSTLSARTENFDRVSRDVGLAGDVQSNLGAASSLSSMAGLGGVGQGIGAVGELSALVEELPRLKTAVQGMPATINAAGAALGTSGVGLIGALGIAAVAIAAVGVAWKRFMKQVQESVDFLNHALDAQYNADLMVAQGATTAEVQAELARISAEIEAKQREVERLQSIGANRDAMFIKDDPGERLKATQKELQALSMESAALEQAIQDGRTATADRTQAEEEFNAQLNSLIGSEKQLRNSIKFLEDALASGKLSVEEQASAERKLGDLRTQLYEELNKEEIEFNERLDSLIGSTRTGSSDIEFLQQAIDSGKLSAEERAAAEAKLGELMEESVGEIDKVAESLKRLRLDADNINQDSFGLRGVGVRSEEDLKASQEAAKKRREDSRRAAESQAKDAAKLADEIRKTEQKMNEQRRKLMEGYSADILKIERSRTRQLEDIERQRTRDEANAASSRNFQAILDIRQRAQEAQSDANLAATRQANDRREAFERQRAEQQRANQQQLAELRSKVQTENSILQEGYNQAIGLARGFVKSIQREFENGQRSDVRRQVRDEMKAITR